MLLNQWAKSNDAVGTESQLVHSEWRLRQTSKSRAFRDRGTRFITAPHLIENGREQDILTWLVWLTGNCAALCAACVFEAILPHSYIHNQVERIGFMHIEPARMTQCGIRAFNVALFRIDAA